MRFRQKSDAPDLQTQFEQLLDQVWECERRERMNDRLDAQEQDERARAKRHTKEK